MTKPLELLRISFSEVFSSGFSAALAAALAMAAFGLAVWAPNLALLARVFADPDKPLTPALGLALALLGGIARSSCFLSDPPTSKEYP